MEEGKCKMCGQTFTAETKDALKIEMIKHKQENHMVE